MKFISFKTAVKSMIILLLFVIAFHLLVLLEVIPFTIIWAGRIQTTTEMRVFESLSVILNTILLLAVLRKANHIRFGNVTAANVVLWIFVVIFILNTVGNIFAQAAFERWVFTPLTFISAILCYRIIRG